MAVVVVEHARLQAPAGRRDRAHLGSVVGVALVGEGGGSGRAQCGQRRGGRASDGNAPSPPRLGRRRARAAGRAGRLARGERGRRPLGQRVRDQAASAGEGRRGAAERPAAPRPAAPEVGRGGGRSASARAAPRPHSDRRAAGRRAAKTGAAYGEQVGVAGQGGRAAAAPTWRAPRRAGDADPARASDRRVHRATGRAQIGGWHTSPPPCPGTSESRWWWPRWPSPFWRS